MKPDLTHQKVARVLLQECPHLFTKNQLSFLNTCTRLSFLTEKQEGYLAVLDQRRTEDVR